MAQKVTSKVLPSASQLVQNFLNENNIEIKLEAIDSLNQWVDGGFVLNDKPLLKVKFEFKDAV